MQVFRSLSSYQPLASPVVTIGTFDGVHLGHQAILARLQAAAQRLGGQTLVITFHPHPRTVLRPDDHSLRLLNTLDEKLTLLEAKGVEATLVVPFTVEFSQLESGQFIQEVLIKTVKLRHIAVGYDHRFGRNRGGGLEELAQYGQANGFTVEEIPALLIDEANVSSTKIRHALESGDVALANRYLGQSYTLTGTVVHGDKIGRTLGYPTANLEVVDKLKLIPSIGVYAVYVRVEGKRLKGMLNIGYRPTVGGKDLRIEVNILDFTADLYGKELTLEFVARIRDDAHFGSLEELVVAMNDDKAATYRLLES
jgi:riboflavin kinase / FMN adenylyltransferase